MYRNRGIVFPEEMIEIPGKAGSKEFRMISNSTRCGAPPFSPLEKINSTFTTEFNDIIIPKSLYQQKHLILLGQYFLCDTFGSKRRYHQLINTWPQIISFDHSTTSVNLPTDFIGEVHVAKIATDIPPPLIVSMSPEDKNVFHFMFETLPRLACLEILDLDTPLIFGYIPTKLQVDFLRLLGITNKILILPDHTFLIRRVVFTSHPEPGFCSRSYLSWLRGRVATDTLVSDSSPKYIFINRNDSRLRTLLNRKEIEEVLSLRGFVSLSLSEYELSQQISFFVNAKIVVFEHGAGASFLAFCQSIMCAVELTQEAASVASGVPPHYGLLCGSLGFTYRILASVGDSDGSYSIDPSALVGILTEYV